MELSTSITTEPMHHRSEKDIEMLRKIDDALAEETTLQEGLTWAIEHNWMSPQEADECLRAYHLSFINSL